MKTIILTILLIWPVWSTAWAEDGSVCINNLGETIPCNKRINIDKESTTNDSIAWEEVFPKDCKKVCPRGWMNWKHMDTCRQICRVANALEAGCK